MSESTISVLRKRIMEALSVRGASARRRTRWGATRNAELLEDRRLLSAVAPQVGVSPVYKPVAAPHINAAPAVSGLAPLNQTFNLNSRPSATKTIYLDFNGNTTSGTLWNTVFSNGQDFVTPAFSLDSDGTTFSDPELTMIQRIWQRVAEDYAPFDVNVTTQDPGVEALRKSGAGDTQWGVRVAVGGTNSDWYNNPNSGGVAFLGSFSWDTDTPCFAFSVTQGNDEVAIAETCSHEAGHTLGLSHDGTATLSYYLGHGSGVTSWAPIMGAGFYSNVSQWSKGEYPGANNQEDDLAIITSQNGFGYRPDDYGSSRLAATAITTTKAGTTKTVNMSGVIEKNTDTDWLSFTTTGGNVNLTFDVAAIGANLDMSVSLYDATGTLLLVSSPSGALGASISTNLPNGKYYVMIDGVGFGDLTTGYSDYGSLGQYTITGTIPDTSSGNSGGGTAKITGKVISDANGNGVTDGSDAGIKNVVVFIDLNGDGQLTAGFDKSTLTDANGNYSFGSLQGGTYQIYQVVPTGWAQSNPSSGPVQATVSNGGTTAAPDMRDLRPPVIGSIGSTVTYQTASPAAVISSTVTVSDADTTNFDGFKLNVSLTNNMGANDILSIRNQGLGAGQVGFFSGAVRYSGIVIGTVTGGSGSPLVITFNSQANSLMKIQAVLRNITFATTSSKLTRTVSFQLIEKTGGMSNVATKQIVVT